MSGMQSEDQRCVIIGGSHAGVSAAFALRKYGWKGEIHIYEKTTYLPYQRPPLSKTFFYEEQHVDLLKLKSADNYVEQNIQLFLHTAITAIDRDSACVTTDRGNSVAYDYLIYACGARALVPSINGINHPSAIFCVRDLNDILRIKEKLKTYRTSPQALIIGGGYIGLEIASSLRKMDVNVVLLERENRLLKRVTVKEVSSYFDQLHSKNKVRVIKQKNVTHIEKAGKELNVFCEDGMTFTTDIIIVGVGIQRNTSLAKDAGLTIKKGIVVNQYCQTNDPSIYAIGDCAMHDNKKYKLQLSLESIQNANDQAKVAAATICGHEMAYDPIPWFWSDQYDTKLQTVGISTGYTDKIVRQEIGQSNSLSIWYFRDEKLLAVDAINHPKAYVLATRIIKKDQLVNKENCANPEIEFSPLHMIVSV